MGIDPGLASLGWALLETEGQDVINVEYGSVRTHSSDSLPDRLDKIHHKLQKLVNQYEPEVLAIEDLIFSSNQLTAIQVAQARGVCILAFAQRGITVYEYSPPEIKRAIVGYGRATKEQIQKMVMQILHLEKIPRPSHASDAIAAALCHLYHLRLKNHLPPEGK